MTTPPSGPPVPPMSEEVTDLRSEAAAPPTLDEAWAEAEAALPIAGRLVMWQDHQGPRYIQVLTPERPTCECGDPDCDHLDEVMAPRISILVDYPSKGLGEGPVVELRALAARLKAEGSGPQTGPEHEGDERTG